MVMSTYLVAFVVGPARGHRGRRRRRHAAARRAPARAGPPHGVRAGDRARFALAYFADYYGIPYPGDKVDLVAVPDFAFGAMENLGCITFREVLLLVDPATATQPELQRVADVIAHELAHMWFGDLVTMRWWNGHLAERGVRHVHGDALHRRLPARLGALGRLRPRPARRRSTPTRSPRPVPSSTRSCRPADAEGMFDILTYEKGAAVVRMIEQYLGEDRVPRRASAATCSRHAYGNTETTDLWDALEAATRRAGARASWTAGSSRAAIPLVDASTSPTDGTRCASARSRFRYLAARPTAAAVDGAGAVARVAAGGAAPSRSGCCSSEPERPSSSTSPPTPCVLANAGGHGFYRVRYDDDPARALTARAQDRLTPIERYTLVDDTYAALLAGRTGVASFLRLAVGLADDDDLSVWQRLSGALGSLARVRGRWRPRPGAGR